MSEPFIGEIRMFGFSWVPEDWALCDGQLLLISQNASLYSLLGTTYGGNGTTDFALPDLRGRVPMSAGQGVGLSNRVVGASGGQEVVWLNETQIPSHTHTVSAQVETVSAFGNQTTPGDNRLARADDGEKNYSSASSDSTLAGVSATASETGGGSWHTNVQPFLVVLFCIALTGVYPSRS
ncbi:MAG: phage tail protein [Kiritimatiellae bacterium]|nr:phage tail protein [Kiritimatiellia bacterium]